MIVASLLLALSAVALLVVGLTGGSGPYLIGSIAASLLAAITLVAGGRQFGEERADGGSARLGDGSIDHLGGDTADPVAAPGDPVVASASRAPAPGGAPHPDRTRSGQLLLAVDDGSGHRHDSSDLRDDGSGLRDDGSGLRDDGSGLRHDVSGPNGHIPAGDRAGVAVLDSAADHADPGDPAATGEPGEADDEEPPDEPVAQPVSPSDAARLAGMGDDVLVIDGRPRYHLPGCVHLLTRESERLPVREAVELGFTPCGLCEPASALLTGDRRA